MNVPQLKKVTATVVIALLFDMYYLMQFTRSLSLLRELALVPCISWPTENIKQTSTGRLTMTTSRSSENAVAHVRDREVWKEISKTS